MTDITNVKKIFFFFKSRVKFNKTYKPFFLKKKGDSTQNSNHFNLNGPL